MVIYTAFSLLGMMHWFSVLYKVRHQQLEKILISEGVFRNQ